MTNETETWKIGTILVYENYSNWGRQKIVRETPTTWVLDNDLKIKKGSRTPIGMHGFSIPLYFSIEEEQGKKIQDRMVRASIIGKIKNYDFQNMPTKKLKALMTYINELEEHTNEAKTARKA